MRLRQHHRRNPAQLDYQTEQSAAAGADPFAEDERPLRMQK